MPTRHLGNTKHTNAQAVTTRDQQDRSQTAVEYSSCVILSFYLSVCLHPFSSICLSRQRHTKIHTHTNQWCFNTITLIQLILLDTIKGKPGLIQFSHNSSCAYPKNADSLRSEVSNQTHFWRRHTQTFIHDIHTPTQKLDYFSHTHVCLKPVHMHTFTDCHAAVLSADANGELTLRFSHTHTHTEQGRGPAEATNCGSEPHFPQCALSGSNRLQTLNPELQSGI